MSELAKVGQLSLLKAVYGEVLIPEEVYNEVTSGVHPAIALVKAADWIQVRSISNIDGFERLRQMTRLGKGECAAMILAEELKANQVLI
ncbi:MAG: hypothetical protein AAGB19_23090 [Cyanobacteria bacterium P01_F01_bin.3]